MWIEFLHPFNKGSCILALSRDVSSYYKLYSLIIAVQLLCPVRLSATPWMAAHQDSLSFTVSQSLLMSIELMMPSNHLIFCHPRLLLPLIFPSIRVFPRELAVHFRCPKYWGFSFSISPSNEYSGLILLGLTGLISLPSKGLSRVFSSTTFESINSLALSLLYGPTCTFIHDK